MEELVHIIYNRHAEADWCNDGDLDQHDIDVNERALESGGPSLLLWVEVPSRPVLAG